MVEVDVPDRLQRGTYALVWRVVSIDGHSRAGTLTFSVGSQSTRVSAPDLPDPQRSWLTVTRAATDALTYLGLLVTVGLAVFVRFVVPGAASGPHGRIRRWLLAAATIGGAAALLRIPLVTLDQQGITVGDLSLRATWSSVPGDTVIGALVVVAGSALVLLGTGARARRFGQSWVLLGALLALAGPTTTGHTRSLDAPVLAALVDGWHLLALVRDGSGNAVETSAPPAVEMTGPDGEHVRVEGLELTDRGSYEAPVELPAPGDWRATVVQRLDEFSRPSARVLLRVGG